MLCGCDGERGGEGEGLIREVSSLTAHSGVIASRNVPLIDALVELVDLVLGRHDSAVILPQSINPIVAIAITA